MTNLLNMKSMRPGKLLGLDILISPTALIGCIVVTLVAAGLFAAWAGLSTGDALIGGILAMLLWWVSEFLHHVGHSMAARRTGYPMTGILFHTILGSSLYPRDEPALPGSIHIRRALGGPAASFVVFVVSLVLTLLIPASTSPVLNAVFAFTAAANLLVFSAGAFLPLGFTDGSTILNWWGK